MVLSYMNSYKNVTNNSLDQEKLIFNKETNFIYQIEVFIRYQRSNTLNLIVI